MKFRFGLISNSSNSCFLVLFPKRPKSIDETRKMMFPDGNVPPRLAAYINEVSTDQVVAQVFKDIKGMRALGPKQIKEFLALPIHGTNTGIPLDEMPEYPGYVWKIKDNGEFEVAWEKEMRKFNSECDEWAAIIYDTMREMYPDHKAYLLFYGDEDGPFFSVMEHAGIFDKVPHFWKSNH